MRRILIFITLLCLICGLFISTKAVSGAESVQSTVSVTSDGGCQVTMTVALHLDQSVSNLKFPLPRDATDITLNGKRVKGKVENGLRQIDLSGIVGKNAGNFTFTFIYTLSGLVSTNKAGQPELQLPLLSGFSLPVQKLTFSVALPGEITAKPAFSSGYHQADIEKDISVTVSGSTVTGSTQTELKDHETLAMSLSVTEEMFPPATQFVPNFDAINLITLALTLLAAGYWLVFLRNLPRLPKSRSATPDGFSEGALAGVLFLQGSDLNMMVFSWAQSGYLLMELRRNGKVLLHRQMDMGNERSNFEQRCFQALFSNRTMIDTGTQRYADLCRKVERTKPNLATLVHPKSGSITLFRVLGLLIGGLSGVSIGMAMSGNPVVQWLLGILFGALALASGWQIQRWVYGLFSPEKYRVWLALGLCVIWALFGSSGLMLAASQLIIGILAAFGGRRTLSGRQAQTDVLGLRRYLVSVSPDQLRQICLANPEYFHQMYSYAMALGVHKRFAKRFRRLPVSPCPYLTGISENIACANQWCGIMQQVLDGLYARQRPDLKTILRKYIVR